MVSFILFFFFFFSQHLGSILEGQSTYFLIKLTLFLPPSGLAVLSEGGFCMVLPGFFRPKTPPGFDHHFGKNAGKKSRCCPSLRTNGETTICFYCYYFYIDSTTLWHKMWGFQKPNKEHAFDVRRPFHCPILIFRYFANLANFNSFAFWGANFNSFAFFGSEVNSPDLFLFFFFF